MNADKYFKHYRKCKLLGRVVTFLIVTFLLMLIAYSIIINDVIHTILQVFLSIWLFVLGSIVIYKVYIISNIKLYVYKEIEGPRGGYGNHMEPYYRAYPYRYTSDSKIRMMSPKEAEIQLTKTEKFKQELEYYKSFHRKTLD